MKALYKPGDRVLIKSKYDKGAKENSYRFVFVENMLETFGGHICTISEVSDFEYRDSYQVMDDNHKYYIKEDNSRYSWASSMFEPEF